VLTAETAQLLFENAGVAHWNVYACVRCGRRGGFRFEKGQRPLWHGDHKDCSQPLPPRRSSWQDVASHLNELPVDMLDGSSPRLPRIAAGGDYYVAIKRQLAKAGLLLPKIKPSRVTRFRSLHGEGVAGKRW
jgi:hypothetical protein